MITESIDKRTGTILFNEDEESKNIKYLLKKVEELENRISKLENKKKKKEDS